MKIRTLSRHIREGFKNLARNGWMTVASVMSVTITLLILGVFLLLAMNVNQFAQELEGQVEIRAFLDLESGAEERQAVEQKLKSIPEVDQASITFVPKDEGIEQFIEDMGEQGQYFVEFKDENNPLPDVLVIQTINPQDTERIAKQIEQFDHIYKVNYGAGKVDKLFAVTNTMRNVGVIFIVGLAFTAMLLIANTIKLTIVARSREIEIMKLVGATNSFIRWPFFIEGLLLGVLGAITPIVILLLGYQQLLLAVGETLSINFFALLPIYPLAYQIAGLLLGIGAFIGVWGSVTSVRRFLKV